MERIELYDMMQRLKPFRRQLTDFFTLAESLLDIETLITQRTEYSTNLAATIVAAEATRNELAAELTRLEEEMREHEAQLQRVKASADAMVSEERQAADAKIQAIRREVEAVHREGLQAQEAHTVAMNLMEKEREEMIERMDMVRQNFRELVQPMMKQVG